MSPALAIILTFMIEHGQTHDYKVDCPDMACIEDVLSHAGESNRLVRARVVRMPFYVDKVSGNLVLPPLMDLWYQ